MAKKKRDERGNRCASCFSPVAPGRLLCPVCSQTGNLRRRVPLRDSEEKATCGAVLRSARKAIKRAISRNHLTVPQGQLLLTIMTSGALLDFSVRATLTSIVMEIAEEADASGRAEKVHALKELVAIIMPNNHFSEELTQAFELE